MGNVCCGKADSDAFQTPGRVLGTAPPQPDRASVPKTHRVIGGPARKLGGGGGSGGGGGGGAAAGEGGSGGAAAEADARQRAAEAAEARAKAAQKTTGKLGEQLQAQKRQSRQETLKEASQNELRAREAEEAARARNYD